MTHAQIFDQVKARIADISAIATRKGWKIHEGPEIGSPATPAEIRAVEKRLGYTLPSDFRELLLFSRRTIFDYQFDENLPKPFQSNFSGHISWDLDELPALQNMFNLWLEASLDPEYNDPESVAVTAAISDGKIAFMNVPNGDVIAMGNAPSEVVYFSHEGDEMHGKILGKNLWDFLEFHSRIGFAGTEDWQFEPFFDFTYNEMVTHGETVDRFIGLLER